MFAKTENIIKYYNRFNLTSLKYKKDPNTKSEITEHAKIFFLGMDKLYRSDDYKSSYTMLFFDKNRRVFNNFLVVLTLAKDVYDYDQIIESLFPVMELKKLIMRDEINSLSDFISKKGKYIFIRLLSKLIKFAVENNQLHKYKIFLSLNQQVIKNQKKILITNRNLFELIKNNFLGTRTLCDHLHTDILMHLTPLLSQSL